MSPPISTAPPHDPVKGIVYKLLSGAGMAVVAAAIKSLGKDYPIGEIVFFRCLLALPAVLISAYLHPLGFRVLKTKNARAHTVRAVISIIGTVSFFGVLLLLPFGDAMALTFSTPLFVVALAGPLLGERIGPYRIGAVIVGFIGVLLIVYPSATGHDGHARSLLGVGVGILAAFSGACSQIVVRALRHDPATTTVFYVSIALIAAALLTAPFGWFWPHSLADWGLLSIVGVVGGLAQLAISHASRMADASTLAPFDYLQLLWAMVIGYVLFSEVPVALVIAGALIVSGSGIFIALRERALKARGQKIEDHVSAPEL